MPALPARAVVDVRDLELKSRKQLGLTSTTLIGDELHKDCQHLEKYAWKYLSSFCSTSVWLNGLVVSALGIRARGPGFDSQVMSLFHWVATLGKLFTHIACPVSQLQETRVQKGSYGGYGG